MSADYDSVGGSAASMLERYGRSGDIAIIYEDPAKPGETQIVSNIADPEDAHERLAALIRNGKVDTTPSRWPGDVHYAIVEEQPWRGILDEGYLSALIEPKKKPKKR